MRSVSEGAWKNGKLGAAGGGAAGFGHKMSSLWSSPAPFWGGKRRFRESRAPGNWDLPVFSRFGANRGRAGPAGVEPELEFWGVCGTAAVGVSGVFPQSPCGNRFQTFPVAPKFPPFWDNPWQWWRGGNFGAEKAENSPPRAPISRWRELEMKVHKRGFILFFIIFFLFFFKDPTPSPFFFLFSSSFPNLEDELHLQRPPSLLKLF